MVTVGEINKALTALFMSLGEDLRKRSAYWWMSVIADLRYVRSSCSGGNHARLDSLPRPLAATSNAAPYPKCHTIAFSRRSFSRRVQGCHWKAGGTIARNS